VQTIFRAYLHGGTFRKAASLTVNIAHLTLERIKPLHFPLPPSAEQDRIVAEVERRLSVVEELDATVGANLKRAERLRQSILKRAFEGRLVPQDPADEPAGALLERIRSERRPGRKGRKKTGAAPPPSRPEDAPLLKQTDAG
jgi:type I restriction enzyme S subunit